MKKSKLFFRMVPALLLFLSVTLSCFAAPKQQYYEVKLYRISGPAQEAVMDAYLKDAYIPALHRAGITNVGLLPR